MKQNKSLISIVAILMMMTFAVSMIADAGVTFAQETQKASFPFIDVIPATVGVGQRALVNFGLLNYLALDGDGWNVTAKITHPDGTVTTFEGMTWSTGMLGRYFVPTEVGEYSMICEFKGEYYNSTTASLRGYYKASTSEPVILTVQEDRVPEHPGYGSEPGNYWTRPVDSQLREWWSFMGSWVARPNNLYAPYNDAPESAHILWTMPIGDTMGGLTGGDNWQVAYQNGDAYEGKFSGSIIISGVLYYNKYVSGSPQQEIVAVDLHTGKVLWSRSYDFGGSRISRGQTLTWLCLNNRGTWSYVWMASGTNMYALDAATGDLKYNMTNVPSGTIYSGPSGEMLKYSLTNRGTADNPNYYLTQWNSSTVVSQGKTGQSESWGSQIQGRTYNATERGYDFNVSVSTPETFTGSILTVFPGNRVIIGAANAANGVTLSAISLEEGREGQVLFRNENTPALHDWDILTLSNIGQAGWAAYSEEDLVAVYWTKENRVNYAFSLATGKFMWQTEQQIYADAWSDTATLSFGPEKLIAYNKLIEASVGGIVYCYDITTGERLWTYEATDEYTEAYISQNWWLVPVFITDNKIYVGHMEHSAMEPKPRGAPFFALDVNTGDVVWKIGGAFRQTRWGGRAIIGDSIIVTTDTYDNRIYAIGKGPVAMTLSTPDVTATVGKPVVIKGTIMDISPGTESDALKLQFPNGVPAVADAYMSEWMLHVYKQFPAPHANGVSITIVAYDSNGNSKSFDVTSDASGSFAFEFTPEIDGKYDIYAIFNGSAAYYGNSAQGTIFAAAASSSSDKPYDLYIIGMGIVVIIVNLIVVLFFVRKK
ncbi:MAG: PQQ-binding-like beta-propeller repeat protein [Candidatus Bathyarchaeota archaeon]|nr:PQQ-binding-like beta-propeller repeat protein [Candidatus Termiticorpusculum sp.]